MACNFPVTVYQDRDGGPVSFHDRAGFDQLSIPCGRCHGCRLGRASSWAIRCQHEAQLHDENCFLTLTYDDKHIPVVERYRDGRQWRGSSMNWTLYYWDVRKFLRSLRKKVAPKRFSFLCAGEYGERTSRPHYHLLLFGHRFDCRLDFARAGVPGRLGESEGVAKLWKLGNHFVGELTAASAAYVSQYCLKKVYGQRSESFYDVVDPLSGQQLGRRCPEFLRMSLRPAIGREWFARYGKDVLPCDFAVSNGIKYRVPRYYEKLLASVRPELLEEVEFAREERLERRPVERRLAREEILRARVARNAERRKV